jgi:hypothetical protein
LRSKKQLVELKIPETLFLNNKEKEKLIKKYVEQATAAAGKPGTETVTAITPEEKHI